MLKKTVSGIIALALTLGVAGSAAASHDWPPSPANGQTYCLHEVGILLVFQDEGGWYPIGSCAAEGSASSVRGTAFEDLNGNGKRDANEPEMGGAWYKVSNGGDWFVCGWVGKDATYSVPVAHMGMTYFVDAIAPVGWRTTTPRVKASVINVAGGAYLFNDLGFVRDASVKTVEGGDPCDPVRRQTRGWAASNRPREGFFPGDSDGFRPAVRSGRASIARRGLG